MPGNLDCYKASYESVMKNLIEPNDADVFILASKVMNIKTISDDSHTTGQGRNVPVTKEDIDNVKRCFGKHLKVFKFDSDIPGYEDDAEEQAKAADKRVSSWITDQGKFIQFYNREKKQLNNARHYIDRFVKMKYIVKLVEEYEKENNIKYDYIVRARIDFIYNFEVDLAKYYKQQDTKFWYDRQDDLWIAESDIAKEILSNLVNHIGEYDGGSQTPTGDYRLDRSWQILRFLDTISFGKMGNMIIPIGITLYRKGVKVFVPSFPKIDEERLKANRTIENFYETKSGYPDFYPDITAWLWIYTYHLG